MWQPLGIEFPGKEVAEAKALHLSQIAVNTKQIFRNVVVILISIYTVPVYLCSSGFCQTINFAKLSITDFKRFFICT